MLLGTLGIEPRAAGSWSMLTIALCCTPYQHTFLIPSWMSAGWLSTKWHGTLQRASRKMENSDPTTVNNFDPNFSLYHDQSREIDSRLDFIKFLKKLLKKVKFKKNGLVLKKNYP